MRDLQFPCTSMKCLTYPTCKHKAHIECHHVGKWYHNARHHYSRNVVWDEMKFFLTGMKSFRDGDTVDPNYIYLEEVNNGGEEYKGLFGQEPGV